MGLLSWLFPTPADRVRKAEEAVQTERFADAFRELLDVDHPDAGAVRARAARGLVFVNLEHAVSWANAGDDERVGLHFELIDDYLIAARAGKEDSGLPEAIRNARQQIRELRAGQEAERRLEKEAREARLTAVDPLGLTGGPSLVHDDEDSPGDPLAEQDDERAARLALVVDAYPPDLRDTLPELGRAFTDAVLDLEEGRADSALLALLQLPDDAALVLYERARAAHLLGDPRAAARTLRRLIKARPHFTVGQHHTAVMLAQMTAESGDAAAALEVLRDARRTEPELGAFLYAQLCLANRELPEAERTLRRLITAHPRQTSLHFLLAQVRLAGEHRASAMRALEAAMETACDSPGRCGHKPPDPEIVRLLATLYLEDGHDLLRARELVDMLPAGESWSDAYLQALLADRSGEGVSAELATRVHEHAPASQTSRVQRYLPAPA